MADSNPKKRKKNSETKDDPDLLKSDIASFASSIGLANLSSSLPYSGFNDSDFRKKGPLNPKTDKPRHSDISDAISSEKNKKSQSKPVKTKNRATVPASKGETPVSNSGKLTKLFSESENQKNGIKTDRKDGKTNLPLMKPSSLSGEWFVDALELERKVLGAEGKGIDVKDLKEWSDLVEKKVKVAERLMEQYSSDYEVSSVKNADKRIALVAKRSGTAADKVAAFTTLVGDNPIANLRSLDALLAMVTSNVGKRHALTGFDALKELFQFRLLPDHKLKHFMHRPLNRLPESKDGFSLLLFWYWEDCLKKRFERFVIALEEASKDALPILKDKSFKTMYQLLASKPEQERRLLSALVNKLGDPDRKAASGAEYHLSCLLSAHPNMTAIVIEEVDRFVLRKHLGLRAKYHAINFLSHIFLSKKGDGPKIAKHLVMIYFGLFKVLISEADSGQGGKDRKHTHKKIPNTLQKSNEESPSGASVEMDSRLLSALLTGVNRAFPFVSTDEADAVIELQTPILFKLVHSKNFNVGVQALMLLYQISSKNEIASDRFYRALYSKLMVPAAMKSSKPEMLLGLLFKAMKSDLKLKRVCAFAKRLLQVALQQPPQYACGCLFILSEVLKARPHLRETMQQSESIEDDFEHFEDIIEDSQNVAETGATNSVTSIGFRPVGVRSDSVRTETILSDSDSDEEHPNSYSEEVNNSEEEEKLLGAAMGIDSLLDMRRSLTIPDGEREQVQKPESRLSLPGGYNPQHREPFYCNADHASWVELLILASHVHPSVATMVRKLLKGDDIIYDGDPLIDLSLSAFLDKFVERKPKPNRRADGVWYGGSQIAPARKLEMSKTLIGPEILSLAEEDVRPEDLIFHKFYMNKQGSSRKKKKKKAKGGDEDAEELYHVDKEDDEIEDDEDEDDAVDDAEENDEEEIDDILGPGPQEDNGNYDYDDLDEVLNNDDDEELLGNDSDADAGSQHGDGDDVVDDTAFSDDGMDGDADFAGDDGDDDVGLEKKKQKLKGRFGASPFASLEEYEHLLNEDGKTKGKSKNKQRKKKSA